MTGLRARVHKAKGLTWYEDGGRTKLRTEACCRMCLEPRKRRGVRMLTRHHIVPQSWIGWDSFGHRRYRVRDCERNIVPLCAACHRAVETDDFARRMLRKVMGQDEIAFAILIRGDAWFNARYPQTVLPRRVAKAA